MMNKNLRNSLASLALAATVVTATALPAKANTTSSILLGVAAAAGILTAVNVEHKHQVANTVEGYLPNGDRVYQDGRVVSQNGQSWYPGNQGQSVQCRGQRCAIVAGNGNGYRNNGYQTNGYDNNGYNAYWSGHNDRDHR